MSVAVCCSVLQCVLRCAAVCCSVASTCVYTLRLEFDYQNKKKTFKRWHACIFTHEYVYIHVWIWVYILILMYIRVGIIYMYITICEYMSWFYTPVGANWYIHMYTHVYIHMYDTNSNIHIYHIYTPTYVHESLDEYKLASKSDFRQILPSITLFTRKSALRSGFFLASPKVVHRPRSQSPLHFDSQNTYQIWMENKMLALGVCLPQTCSSAGRMLAASRSSLQYYQRIVSSPQQKIRWNAL